MVDDDTFTYHVKQQPASQINKAAHSLITKERMQKLDLLIHLLSNLTRALVVCGPKGIGKTTLLKVLQGRKTESWRYCLIQGNADLSFEAIHEQLSQCMNADASLSTAFRQYESQHKQVILIVDNAGDLVPGLISTIIQYAAANPVLRVVFALTHDELQVKRGSDRAIDDCHIVEIPPLSEKQCGDFLQDLSTKPYANLSFEAIGENMIAHIYRETHGVPGRIIAEVSGISSGKTGGKLKWVLVSAVAAAIVIAFGVQLLASKNNDKDVSSAPAAVEQKADAVAPPQPEAQITPTLQPVQPVTQSQQLAPTVAEAPVNEVKPSVEVNLEKVVDQPLAISAVKPETFSAVVSKPLPEQLAVQPQIEPVASAAQAEQKPGNTQPVATPQKVIESEGGAQEKLKQTELAKTGNEAKPPVPEKPAAKSQPESLNKAAEPVVAQQKIFEPSDASREKPKTAEPNKKVNIMEQAEINKLEAVPSPQAQTEISVAPKAAAIEQGTSQQAEGGTLPIATVPPSPAASRIDSPLVAAVPSIPAAEAASSANNFTLQLMVLSKQSSADVILKKYPAMESDIRVVKTVANGKEKFILEYGSYSDAASANKARESLPFEFRKALVRKIAR